ncbi:hypothetical protein MGWOODY_Mmi1459 [hydrothermal vent metagenome]|uniref:Uncharacterized protein n=1 Tax=hydrothermal vent metagenome TaxID=652676 RepID=A0A160VEJ0_9ZZZZ
MISIALPEADFDGPTAQVLEPRSARIDVGLNCVSLGFVTK